MRKLEEILKDMRALVVSSGAHSGDSVDADVVHHAINRCADEIDAWRKDKVVVPVNEWNWMAKKVEVAYFVFNAVDSVRARQRAIDEECRRCDHV